MNFEELKQCYDFTGRTIAITGGAGILCGEMACSLVSLGANVVILDRDVALADRLKDRLESGPGRSMVLAGDVLSRDSLVEVEQRIRSEFGVVDTLINGAGGNQANATTSDELSFFDLPDDALRRVFNLNMLGTFLPCQVFGKGMVELGKGNILNVSSMSAYRPLTRVPAYSAAKAGISNFTQWLAVLMARDYAPNIRVNALAPGFFITSQNRFLLTDEKTSELTERGRLIIAHTPMQRFGEPEDLIGTVLWLLSDMSSFVTGVVVPVDGGFNAFGGV
ncbi:MAG: SDR family oxidoreductase [Anaerolineae bacterium]|nr:SDR family oxidoreductase [Anaerolineae bacterium]